MTLHILLQVLVWVVSVGVVAALGFRATYSYVSLHSAPSRVVQYMNHLAETYPKLARIVTLGESHEGRSILGLKIGRESEGGDQPLDGRHTRSSGRADDDDDEDDDDDDGGDGDDHRKGKMGFLISAEQHAREVSLSNSVLHSGRFEVDLKTFSSLYLRCIRPYNATVDLDSYFTVLCGHAIEYQRKRRGQSCVADCRYVRCDDRSQ